MKRAERDEQKRIQLNVLSRFMEICEKHQLKYSVAGGTLIGTIRHKGYIPWDDDIDIHMPRRDYDRFVQLYKEQYNDGKIKIIDRDTEKKYHMNFAKLHDTSTVLREKKVIDRYAMLYGIYIDIFPLDYVSKNESDRKKFLKKNYYALKIITMNVINLDVPHKRKIMAYIYNSLWYILKLVPLSILTGIEEKKIRKYSEANMDSGYLRELAFGDLNCDYVFYESDFSSYIIKKFENLDVRVPIGYDRVLRCQYGDYMQLPSESERINHGLDVYYVEG